MTVEKIMFCICVVALVVGTVGLIKDLKVKSRQRQQEKHYAAMRESRTDNE